MNKRQKGNLFQDWVEDWFLQFPGVKVHNQKTVSSLIKLRDKQTGELKDVWVSKRNDILGCIDLIVMIPHKKPLYIQATLDSGITKRLEELAPIPFPLEYCTVQLWQKKDGGEVHIKNYTGSGFEDFGKIIRRKFYKLSKDDAGSVKGVTTTVTGQHDSLTGENPYPGSTEESHEHKD